MGQDCALEYNCVCVSEHKGSKKEREKSLPAVSVVVSDGQFDCDSARPRPDPPPPPPHPCPTHLQGYPYPFSDEGRHELAHARHSVAASLSQAERERDALAHTRASFLLFILFFIENGCSSRALRERERAYILLKKPSRGISTSFGQRRIPRTRLVWSCVSKNDQSRERSDADEYCDFGLILGPAKGGGCEYALDAIACLAPCPSLLSRPTGRPRIRLQLL